MKSVFLYTMTAGLGDYLIMGDVMRKTERLLPGVKCLMTHRQNPHVHLWPDGPYKDRFYNICSLAEMVCLIKQLRKARNEGATIFGLQMAPGSLQGFIWHSFLKKLGALDYIVDFNLINADIITHPEGSYILDWHLNQIKKLFKIEIPTDFFKLNLPLKLEALKNASTNEKKRIGIHPWSRRGQYSSFVWTFDNWKKIIEHLLKDEGYEIVIFGRDARFNEFKDMISNDFSNHAGRIVFEPSSSVENLIQIIQDMDLLISVNTATVHIGHALQKKMIILNGPSLGIWMPKGNDIINVTDQTARWNGADQHVSDCNFPSVSKINRDDVLTAINQILKI